MVGTGRLVNGSFNVIKCVKLSSGMKENAVVVGFVSFSRSI